MKLDRRRCPSFVHSPKATSHTSDGVTHLACAASFFETATGAASIVSGPSSARIARRVLSSNPVPTRPA